MSNLSVPCRAPYEPADVDTHVDKVTMKVSSGDDMDIFNVPVILPCQGSEYFEKR
jgi:hypothetical protein